MDGTELGSFLRARREAVSPAQVGLAAGPRRRTPGLRRAEVATLAGVSVEYVTRLEQGRDRRPSPMVMSALADALRLTTSERVYLSCLTRAADGRFSCKGNGSPARVVRPTVAALLDRLEPTPAVLVNRLSEILAYTAGYERLVAPIGLLDATPPSFLRYVFTDERARTAYPDWDHVADEQVAALKQGPFRADPHVAVFTDELTIAAGDAFAGRLDTIPGLPKPSGVVRLHHPDGGHLRLSYETLDLPADDDQSLIVYLPADEATAAVLDRLNRSRSDTLRLA